MAIAFDFNVVPKLFSLGALMTDLTVLMILKHLISFLKKIVSNLSVGIC